MKKIRHGTLRFGGLAVFLALAFGPASGDETYREYFPRTEIDPTKGVMGDTQYSGTIEYWKDEVALQRYIHWVGDSRNQWKLNWKFMDMEKDDLHMGHLFLDKGEALVRELVRQHAEFARCLGNEQGELKGAAARHPQYDEKLGRIMTVESRVEYCAKTFAGRDIGQGTPDNNAITMYVKSLSNGIPLQVDLQSKPIMTAYSRGERLYHARVGQLNHACASCHSPRGLMGHMLRGETPTTPFGDAAHYPNYRIQRGEIESLQQRFSICQRQASTFPLSPGDPAYLDLEIFLSVLSNGYPITVPTSR